MYLVGGVRKPRLPKYPNCTYAELASRGRPKTRAAINECVWIEKHPGKAYAPRVRRTARYKKGTCTYAVLKQGNQEATRANLVKCIWEAKHPGRQYVRGTRGRRAAPVMVAEQVVLPSVNAATVAAEMNEIAAQILADTHTVIPPVEGLTGTKSEVAFKKPRSETGKFVPLKQRTYEARMGNRMVIPNIKDIMAARRAENPMEIVAELQPIMIAAAPPPRPPIPSNLYEKRLTFSPVIVELGDVLRKRGGPIGQGYRRRYRMRN